MVSSSSSHSPTRNDTEEAHDKYQVELDELLEKYSKLGIVVIGADLNEDVPTLTAVLRGKGHTNVKAKGQATIDFAQWMRTKGLWVPASSHLSGTWWHPGQARWLHLDAFMTTNKHVVKQCKVEMVRNHPWRVAKDPRGISAKPELQLNGASKKASK